MKRYIFFIPALLIITAFIMSPQSYVVDEELFVMHEVDPALGDLRMFWRDADGKIYGSLSRLRKSVEQEGNTLRFAMNGGMYLRDQSPQGLYIENGELKSEINLKNSTYGNFYMQPNGIFYLTENGDANVITTSEFKHSSDVTYATQSGPMLLIKGEYHPKFMMGSSNLHIRNGVGILPNGHVLFAMSKKPVNFYDFATLFKQNGCEDALYLDGFVSRTYLPEKKWIQEDGGFGVIIGEVK
ncbi:phosphodiester glycosidase family protein [Fulvivirga ligni]|uniref:phosphodiester glycosidase family protein n=1 Tax=Fulvivirga ligni TaxID=2904246 RepID=UPI001F207EE5|nr:phosphodiester glycosidase family protein [Fulvivirga ligni]UII20321.1 phosphodiester glycosidase family protein [Fulvivirga ligni]